MYKKNSNKKSPLYAHNAHFAVPKNDFSIKFLENLKSLNLSLNLNFLRQNLLNFALDFAEF